MSGLIVNRKSIEKKNNTEIDNNIMESKITVEIYSDIVCPYCFVGKKRLEEAITQSGLQNVEVRFRAFQLHPTAPLESLPVREFWKTAYGIQDPKDSDRSLTPVYEAGKSVGLDFRYDIMWSCNTRKSHRLNKWAEQYGKGVQINMALMEAYFLKGAKLNDDTVILDIVREIGLNPDDAKKVLDSDQFDNEVSEDITNARALGVTSVPTFVINNKYGVVTGAQPIETLANALKQVAGEQTKLQTIGNDKVEHCTIDNCK